MQLPLKQYYYSNNLIYLSIAGILFIALKLWHQTCSIAALKFLLKPVSKVINLLTDQASYFSPEEGYVFSALEIIIDKSCSGFNFLLVCFLMLSYLLLSLNKQPISKLLCLPSALLIAYFISLISNASRIIISILFDKIISEEWESYYAYIHESIGVISHLGFLIATYLILLEILKHTYKL